MNRRIFCAPLTTRLHRECKDGKSTIKTWSSSLNVEFHHVLRSENGIADALAKLRVKRKYSFACFLCNL